MNVMRIIWAEIRSGENIELYLTLVLSIVIAVLETFSLATPKVSHSLFLSLLVLITYSLLRNRHALNHLVSISSKKYTDTLLTKYPDAYEEDLEAATDLWIVGMNLRRIFPDHCPMIERKLRKGGTLKALILDPDGKASIHAADQDQPTTEEDYINTINRSLRYLGGLKNLASDRVEIRVLDYPLPFGIDAVDINSSRGIMYLRYYPYHSPHGDVPIMVLTPQNRFWYKFYEEQVALIWNKGTIWNGFKGETPRANPSASTNLRHGNDWSRG